MENITKLDENIRQTYFIMFEEGDIRYIFNRSIKWNSIMSTKNIAKLINILGKEAIDHFIIRINEDYEKIDKNVVHLTNTFELNNTIFKIIEIRPEWKNIGREDQWKYIEPRKDELCEKFNAVKRKNDLPNEYDIDKAICKMIKKEFKKWLIEIYDAISEYAKLIQEEIVKTSLGQTIENLKKEIEDLKDKLHRDRTKAEIELSSLRKKCEYNRKTLRKQNYVIDKYNKYINENITEEMLEQIKQHILYD